MSGNLFELYKEYRGHKGTIFSLALQKNSGILFSGANDGMVKAWNTKSHDEKTAVDDTQDRCVWSLACDEEYLFCGGGKAMVKMYDCQTFSVVSSQMFGAEHKSWDMMVSFRASASTRACSPSSTTSHAACGPPFRASLGCSRASGILRFTRKSAWCTLRALTPSR